MDQQAPKFRLSWAVPIGSSGLTRLGLPNICTINYNEINLFCNLLFRCYICSSANKHVFVSEWEVYHCHLVSYIINAKLKIEKKGQNVSDTLECFKVWQSQKRLNNRTGQMVFYVAKNMYMNMYQGCIKHVVCFLGNPIHIPRLHNTRFM